MEKVKNYIQLHLNILLFSLTSVFSKMASVQYNRHGLGSIWLYVFLALMIGNCGIYAIAWQQVIKKFSLSTAYANKSVYLLWSQIWAVVIFHENLSVRNIIGILVVLTGVWRVIVAYGIFFGVLLLNTWCYTKVDMRFGPVIDTAAYVFVLIFSRVILNEKITKGKLVGNLLIIAGILIYTM